MTVTIRAGHPTFSQTFGESPRKALAIHASLAHSGSFAALSKELGNLLEITAFDLPSHGSTADWNGESDYSLLSLQIAETFLGDEPVDLIGHSYGALVAMALAMHSPEKVRTLTLIEPVLFTAIQGSPEWQVHRSQHEPFEAALANGELETASEIFVEIYGGGHFSKFPEKAQRKIISQIPLIRSVETLTHGEGLMQDGGLESLDMPVMIIFGTETPTTIAAICETIAARMPDVGVATVDGAGHMVTMTHPAQVSGLVEVNLSRA